MTARTDHLDPAEPAEWQPASHTWARRAAITAAAEAVRRSKDRRQAAQPTPAGQTEESTA